MHILVLEDTQWASYYMHDSLTSRGHQVYVASSIIEAFELWSKQVFDLLIVDLNLAADGFSEEEEDQAHDGLLTGWVWLTNHVFPSDEEYRSRTIIYSAYIDSLLDIVEKKSLDGITLVRRGEEDEVNRIISIIDKIAAAKTHTRGDTRRG